MKKLNKTPKAIKAWAIVSTKAPKLDVFEIYADKNVHLNDNETIIRVEIKVCK